MSVQGGRWDTEGTVRAGNYNFFYGNKNHTSLFQKLSNNHPINRHNSIPLPCEECDNSLPFSGASSNHCLLCTFSSQTSPPTILPSALTSSCHLFLGLHLNLVFPKFIHNWEFYFLPFSVHARTNVIYLTLLSLL